MAWMAFTAFFFYKYNSYYFDAFSAIWAAMLFNFGLGALLFGGFLLARKKKWQLNVASILGIIFVLSLALTSFNFFRLDFSVLREGSIVKSGASVEFIKGELPEGAELLFTEGQLIKDTEYIFRQFPLYLHQYFDRAGFIESLMNAGSKYAFILILATITFVIFSGLGQSIFYRKIETDITRKLISFFLGTGTVSVAIFFLANLGVYNKWTFFALLAVVLAFSARKIWENIKVLWSYKFSFSGEKILTVLVFSFIVLLLGMELVDSIKTIPLGWDDSNYYIRGAKVLAETNDFTRGIGPTAWMLVMSIPWLFWNNVIGDQIILLSTLLVGLGIFFLLARKFLEKNAATIATAFLLCIPMLNFFLVIDSKVEIPLLFGGAALLLTFTNWLEKERRVDFAAMAFLCGFLLTIKITAVTFVAIFILLVLYVKTGFKYLSAALYFTILSYFALGQQMQTLKAFGLSYEIFGYLLFLTAVMFFVISLIKEKPQRHFKSFYPVFGLALVSALMMTPWSIMHFIQAGAVGFSVALFGKKDIISLTPIDAYCPDSFGFDSDYKRYAGSESGIFGLLLAPWNMTMTKELNSTFISDLSFMFLGILPLWVLNAKEVFAGNKKIQIMFAFSMLYLLLWFFTGSGVAWYGIFFLLSGTILLIYSLEKKEIWWKAVLGFFFAIYFVASFVLRNNYFIEPHMLAYAYGLSSAEEVQTMLYPGSSESAAILVNEENVVLYRVGTHMKFFLPIPEKSFVDDDYLDQYQCIRNLSLEEKKQTFLDSGITHIQVDYTASLGGTYYASEYSDRHADFLKFLGESGWELLYQGKGTLLYKITK